MAAKQTATSQNWDASTSVVSRIQHALPEMSAAMAKIARFLLEHPRTPLQYSIVELADETGTSAATVTRFCRMLGFAGYVPFRVAVASDVGRDSAAAWQSDIGGEFRPEDSPQTVLSTLISAHTRSLQQTASQLDLELLELVARRISGCRHFDIYGVGGSALMAKELEARLYRIGINCHHWGELHAGLTSAAVQDADCVALAISNTGRTESTIQMLQQARAAGALTIALTNNPSSPAAAAADLTITTSAFGRFLQPDDLAAKHVQLLVIDLLYLLIAQQNYSRATSTLAATALAVSPHRRAPRAVHRPPAAERRTVGVDHPTRAQPDHRAG
ncbi:SIS domain-containing protein [Auraticoccus sp. F435]|uniref:SIS domain-containing protein n=1 Tax=Auraticoccus cholistanensis TaxID=2656650 RepID=A0A6A9UUH5_9ACTN|nr:MurR/RpiR family transcriptional regulator [Auraticoccus cholistanensis]MVA74857.1 SIS domain-containing protein [Auraticoccus cholistanensis]